MPVAVACALLAVLSLGGCARDTSPPAPSRTGLSVFAAASLRQAFTAMEAPYEASHPEADLGFSFDASPRLRAQIEEGAPADVFAGADTENAERLVRAGMTRGPATAFASNALALVVPAGNGGTGPVRSAVDLADPGVRIIAAGEDVPITRYADAMLGSLVGQTGYADDFVARVHGNIVSREDNVRAVLAKVETGEGDAAIVYRTDARSSDRVEEIALPGGGAAVADYAAVALQEAPNAAGGSTFVDWLRRPEGQALLARFGFGPPGG